MHKFCFHSSSRVLKCDRYASLDFFTAAFYGLVCECFERCICEYECTPRSSCRSPHYAARPLTSDTQTHFSGVLRPGCIIILSSSAHLYHSRSMHLTASCLRSRWQSHIIFISIFSECIYHFNSFHQWLYRRVTYALMNSKNMMDLISYDDWWWWWRCGGYIILYTCTLILAEQNVDG